jgi:gliding motility-associated-like protein
MKKQFYPILMISLVILSSCKKHHLNQDFCDCAYTPTTQKIDTITLTIPNIITPNGDGFNDTWVINNLNYFPGCKVKIMKPGIFRTVIFESTGYAVPWDGKVKDGKYRFEIAIGDKAITGYVCVIKNNKYDLSGFDCIFNCSPRDPYDPLIGK